MKEYVNRKEVALRLKHSETYIASWTDNCMQEGVHYIHLNGSRKYLYDWGAVVLLAWSRH